MDATTEAAMRAELDRVESKVYGELSALNGRGEEMLTVITEAKAAILAELETVRGEIKALHAYVEKIETEAHEAMTGMMDPDAMMKMAGNFLGIKP